MKKLLLVTAICSLSSTAFANSQGDHVVHGGLLLITPDSAESEVKTESPLPILRRSVKAKVDSVTTLGFGYDYFVTDNITVGLQLGIPPKHKIKNHEGKVVGEVTQTTPEIKAKYLFGESSSQFRPYLGLGIAFASFDGEITDTTTKALLGEKVDVESQTTAVLSAGLQYNVVDNLYVSGSLSYMPLETKLSFPEPRTGVTKAEGDASINPTIVYLSAGYSF